MCAHLECFSTACLHQGLHVPVFMFFHSYHGSSGQQAVPQQQDGVACGGYMLSFVEAVLRTGSTQPSDWVPSALISQHGYEGYKQYLHAKITTSSNYQAAGRIQCNGHPACSVMSHWGTNLFSNVFFTSFQVWSGAVDNNP